MESFLFLLKAGFFLLPLLGLLVVLAQLLVQLLFLRVQLVELGLILHPRLLDFALVDLLLKVQHVLLLPLQLQGSQ